MLKNENKYIYLTSYYVMLLFREINYHLRYAKCVHISINCKKKEIHTNCKYYEQRTYSCTNFIKFSKFFTLVLLI